MKKYIRLNSEDIHKISYRRNRSYFTVSVKKNPNNYISFPIDSVLIIDNEIYEFKKYAEIINKVLSEAKKEFGKKYNMDLKIEIFNTDSSAIHFINEIPHKIDIALKDIVNIEYFEYVLGHEVGHIYSNQIKERELSILEKVFYSFFIIFKHLYFQLCYSIIYLVIFGFLEKNFPNLIGWKYSIHFIGFLHLIYFLFYSEEIKLLIYNIRNLSEIHHNHLNEIEADLYSINRFNGKLGFKIKDFYGNSYTHPNSLNRFLACKFKKRILWPILSFSQMFSDDFKNNSITLQSTLKKTIQTFFYK